jgi:hypothetical protein
VTRWLARLLSPEVRRLERERDDLAAKVRLLERELRAEEERHRADVEAHLLSVARSHGMACWDEGVADA